MQRIFRSIQRISRSSSRARSFAVDTAVPSLVPLLVAGGLVVVGTGCGASTTLQKEWEADVGMDSREINVEPKREHLLVGKEKETTIIDANGNTIYGQEEGGFLNNVKEAAKEAADIQVAGVSLSEMKANKLDYAMLSGPGVALAFDYSASDDIIRALDLETGEKMWERSDYEWSLEKYQAVGAKVVTGVVKNVGLAAGAATAAANSVVMRERYVSNLVAKVPGRNAVLLKTVGEVRRVNLKTGETQWTIDKVEGSSLMNVKWLPSGDVVLATDYTSLLGRVQGGKKVIRLNPKTGAVKWRTDHDSDVIKNTFLWNDLIVYRQGDGDLEAFQIEEGTKAYEIGMDWKANLASGSFTDDQGQEYSVSLGADPVLHGDNLYALDLADVDVVGRPDYNVRKIGLAEGESQWSTDPVKEVNTLTDLKIVNDRIVARAMAYDQGLFGDDGRQKIVSWSLSDGKKKWQRESPYNMSRSGLVGMAAKGGEVPSSFNMIVDNGRAYVANDTSIVAYGLKNGKVVDSAPTKALGKGVWLAEQKRSIMDLRDEGVSFHSKSDLSLMGTPIEFESDLVSFTPASGYLVVSTGDVFHVINMKKRTMVGTVAPDDAIGSRSVSGNLQSGVFVTEGAESLFVLTEDTDDEKRLVKKYAIQ
jgi:outer membrane protein assembly factor BamB